jgi:hypothetical protein
MRDGGGVALALEPDLGVIDRAGRIRKQDELEIDGLRRIIVSPGSVTGDVRRKRIGCAGAKPPAAG